MKFLYVSEISFYIFQIFLNYYFATFYFWEIMNSIKIFKEVFFKENFKRTVIKRMKDFVYYVKTKPVFIILIIVLVYSSSNFLNSIINLKKIPYCLSQYQRKCTSCPPFANCSLYEYHCLDGYINDMKGKQCLKESNNIENIAIQSKQIKEFIKTMNINTISEISHKFTDYSTEDIQSLITYEGQYLVTNDGRIEKISKGKSIFFYLSLTILISLTIFLVLSIQ